MQKQPVWEVTGAEFTNQGVHTADGISIRFPRVTRIRDDKCWKTATNLHELRALFKNSAESIDYSLLLGPDAKKRSKSEGTDSSEPKAKKSKKPDKPEKMEVDDADEDQETKRKKPKESSKSKESSRKSDRESSEKTNGSSHDKSRAKYYSFIGTDVSVMIKILTNLSNR